ncbi:phosphodiester glycosidase family protein [Pseudoflavitalea sp. G-6-1-2]|uniref:phosphodiester glycosidase family protein n=1 Tax=Pseudoflavitalea sp. G-6-1-2 TaxID=2728841 RepID=UPI00146E9342|nr:phosphodiester glycosidase family protein [Pseudoflavitalea sp. G-6-1-2]NML21514.1 phosphodiester glycosidase family protein [Pseudoflavitalea sp. G-6-1-2]
MKRTALLGSILIFLNAPFSFGQIDWKRADDSYGQLPAGIKLFFSKDSLNGRPFVGYFIEADLKDKKLNFTTQTGNGKRFTPSQYHTAENQPYVVVNATFFSFQTNQNLNMVMKEGKLVAYNTPSLKSKSTDSFYYPTYGAIGINKQRNADVAWTFTDTAMRWPYAFQERPVVARGTTPDPAIKDLHTLDKWHKWRMRTAVGGGPVLVKDHEIFIPFKEEQKFVNGENDRHPRTAMGYTANDKLIILVIQGRTPGVADGTTLKETARILTDLGCVEALNLDGGGSSCMLVNGKETIKPSDKEGQRPVPAVFIIEKRK